LPLEQLLALGSSGALYEHDFGDNWLHRLPLGSRRLLTTTVLQRAGSKIQEEILGEQCQGRRGGPDGPPTLRRPGEALTALIQDGGGTAAPATVAAAFTRS
jgi:hypothetical protein